MKRKPLGVVVLGGVFVLWSLRGFARLRADGAGPADDISMLALVLVTLATGIGLIGVKRWSLPAYAIWVGLVIVLGGVAEFRAGTPPSVVAVGLALLVAVYLAVGLYLRGALRES